MIEQYFQIIAETISVFPVISSSQVTYDKRSAYVGFIRGEIFFVDGSCLHIREYVNVQSGTDRYMYSFHYQRRDHVLIFRYDNAPHYPDLDGFPHHKHLADDSVIAALPPPVLSLVLNEIQQQLLTNE